MSLRPAIISPRCSRFGGNIGWLLKVSPWLAFLILPGEWLFVWDAREVQIFGPNQIHSAIIYPLFPEKPLGLAEIDRTVARPR